jgi:hypothetical protein
MIFHSMFLCLILFFINDLMIFYTMNGLKKMAWYFVEALILRVTIP